MGAFQRQILTVQEIKKKFTKTINKLFTYKFLTLKTDVRERLSFYV